MRGDQRHGEHSLSRKAHLAVRARAAENRRRTSTIKTHFRRLQTAVEAGDARDDRRRAPQARLADRQGRRARRDPPQQRRAQEGPRRPHPRGQQQAGRSAFVHAESALRGCTASASVSAVPRPGCRLLARRSRARPARRALRSRRSPSARARPARRSACAIHGGHSERSGDSCWGAGFEHRPGAAGLAQLRSTPKRTCMVSSP